MTTQSASQNVLVGIEQGGARGFVKNGGAFDIESGGALKIAGTDVTAQLAKAMASPAGGNKFVGGQISTATAADTVITGLATVVACGATFDSDPGDDPMLVSATIGDQAGSPAAGSIIVKTWKNTGGTDPTPLAATTFTKKVNWWAFGS
ncbi:hypothetical protein [Bradyrhizobium sp. SEMIA]|uniref:hypothetical protein n=1 Tax=Bradyrhizobium sp. SEMIA TaxID=2597515 RepID=UPI0018A5805F|nr:hypothetical protein [Bradyrhizobium sp. SEMIA]QOG20455.1 hypothetical protein FOM02_26980 [Bradyrhizobium sp. SEMIA]